MRVITRHSLLWLTLPLAYLCVAGYLNLGAPFGTETLPRDLPLIGAPRLLGSNRPRPGIPAYFSLAIPLCNRGPGTLQGDVQITSGSAEIIQYEGQSGVYRGGGFAAPAGTYSYAGLCDVRQQRSQTIRLRVIWRRGATSGVLNYAITPNQDDTVHT